MSTCLSRNIEVHRRFYAGIVILIVFSICALLYLQGKEYAQCICVFPDEIMDFHFSISSHIGHDEQIRPCTHGSDTPLFLNIVEMCTTSVRNGSHIPVFLFLENLLQQDCRDN